MKKPPIQYWCYIQGLKVIYTFPWVLILLFLTLQLDAAVGKDGVIHAAYFQQKKISGTVMDEKNQVLPGVSILVKGTTKSTVTNAEGKFSIDVPDNAEALLLTYIGMEPQEVIIDNNTSMVIKLKQANSTLADVVVVGYGTQKRTDITGAVASIKGKELTETPVANLSNALVGRLPGLVAVNPSGKPGSGSSMSIRGASTFGDNSVLLVVDGIVRDFQQLDPNEVESMSVLKDASAAAVYGSRAANGVILVTTKRGKKGKPTFSYNGYAGVQQPTLYPRLMTGYEYALTKNEALKNMGSQPEFSAAQLEDLRSGKVGTDWYKATFKRNAFQMQHNLSINGGSDAILYFLSLGYASQNGMYDNINFKRYRIRSNVDAKITSNLTISADLDAGLEDNNGSSFSAESIFGHVIRQRPFLDAYHEDGLPNYVLGEHPVEETKAGYDRSSNSTYQANLYFKQLVPFIKGLSVTGKAAFGRNYFREKIYSVPVKMYSEDSEGNITNVVSFGGYNAKIGLNELFREYNTTTLTVAVNYSNVFGRHAVGGMFLYEQFEAKADSFGGFRTNFPAAGLDELFWGADREKDANGTSYEDARRSYVGRFNYAYMDRYLLEASFRVDGSVAFPESKKYGFFPAVSIGWRISEENFIKNNGKLSFIDNLKLRGSYGLLGSDKNVYTSNGRVPTFQYLQVYKPANGIISGADGLPGIAPGTLPNPNVTWESAIITDIGLEGGLWKNIFQFEIDAFYKRTSNILLSRIRSVPLTLGAQLPAENYAVVDNKGIEISLTHQHEIGSLNYFLKVNGSFSRNKVITLDEPANIPAYLRQTGQPLGVLTGYKSLGYFQSDEEVADYYPQFNGGQKAGDVKYADINGDKKIDAADQVILSKDNSTPRVIYGLSLGFNFKGFDCSLLFQGAAKAKIILAGTARNFFNGGGSSNNFAFMLDYWTSENRNAKFPRPWVDTNPNNSQTSDIYMRDISYFRFKSFELGYTFSDHILERSRFKRLRIYCSGLNIFTLDKLHLFDPEVSATSGAYYPQQRNLNIGVNLNF